MTKTYVSYCAYMYLGKEDRPDLMDERRCSGVVLDIVFVVVWWVLSRNSFALLWAPWGPSLQYSELFRTLHWWTWYFWRCSCLETWGPRPPQRANTSIPTTATGDFSTDPSLVAYPEATKWDYPQLCRLKRVHICNVATTDADMAVICIHRVGFGQANRQHHIVSFNSSFLSGLAFRTEYSTLHEQRSGNSRDRA